MRALRTTITTDGDDPHEPTTAKNQARTANRQRPPPARYSAYAAVCAAKIE
jgi:hypothetical protein